MRNRSASGDLMQVDGSAVPTVWGGDRTYQPIGAYAVRDGRRRSVCVVTRRPTATTMA